MDNRVNLIRFEIPGEPGAKARPKFSTQGGFVRAITPEKTVNYETLVKLAFQEQCPGVYFDHDKALGMWVYARRSTPKSASKRKTARMVGGDIRPGKKPDYDNIGKIVSDALNGIAYKDDAQIVDGRTIKLYSAIPSVVVEIWEEGENG